jgi:hypothetical protein
MPSKKQRIVVYCSPEEYEAISESAKRAGLSLSTFMKTVCMGMEVPSLEHSQAMRDMVKVSADLGRLGGLFKLAIAQERVDKIAMHNLLTGLRVNQDKLKLAIEKMQ